MQYIQSFIYAEQPRFEWRHQYLSFNFHPKPAHLLTRETFRASQLIIYFLKHWHGYDVKYNAMSLAGAFGERQARPARRQIREHGRRGSPATINQTPNGFPHTTTTTTHFSACLTWPTSWNEEHSKKKKTLSEEVFFAFLLPRGRARLAEITGKYSPNNRFSNTSSGQVGCRRGPGARQRQVRWLVNVMRLKFSTHAHPCLTPLSLMLSSLQHAILSISLLVSPLPPARPSLPFRVQRPESNLQQLSKSGMTDKLIFSSWVYIPGIWAADLAPNKRRVSASCLLNLMFSWPEMNYPVMRIYLYSS